MSAKRKLRERAQTLRTPAPASRLPLSARLSSFLREAERGGNGAQAEAINAVIVALSDARFKAQQARNLVAGVGLTTLMDEIGAL